MVQEGAGKTGFQLVLTCIAGSSCSAALYLWLEVQPGDPQPALGCGGHSEWLMFEALARRVCTRGFPPTRIWAWQEVKGPAPTEALGLVMLGFLLRWLPAHLLGPPEPPSLGWPRLVSNHTSVWGSTFLLQDPASLNQHVLLYKGRGEVGTQIIYISIALFHLKISSPLFWKCKNWRSGTLPEKCRKESGRGNTPTALQPHYCRREASPTGLWAPPLVSRKLRCRVYLIQRLRPRPDRDQRAGTPHTLSSFAFRVFHVNRSPCLWTHWVCTEMAWPAGFGLACASLSGSFPWGQQPAAEKPQPLRGAWPLTPSPASAISLRLSSSSPCSFLLLIESCLLTHWLCKAGPSSGLCSHQACTHSRLQHPGERSSYLL